MIICKRVGWLRCLKSHWSARKQNYQGRIKIAQDYKLGNWDEQGVNVTRAASSFLRMPIIKISKFGDSLLDTLSIKVYIVENHFNMHWACLASDFLLSLEDIIPNDFYTVIHN